MNKINITQHGNETSGYLLMKNEKNDMGRLNYIIHPDRKILTISYVMVYPEYGGQGYGKKLVEKAIEWARKEGWTLDPHCSYARTVLERKTDIADVYTSRR